jgi:hypothetical protein
MGKQRIRFEDGQTAKPFEALTNSGDNQTFAASYFPVSDGPIIAPYGLLTGGAITATGTNNQVAIAALTLLAAGMTGANSDGVVSVAGGNLSITRGSSGNICSITSITVDSSGALAAIAGTASTAFSETRGGAGGPPFIPVGSVEIGQVRTTSVTSAPVTAAEIFAVPGSHLELADQPGYDLDPATGELTFDDTLPLIHTGSLPKKVYLKGATPIFAKCPDAYDWVAAKESDSVSSQDTYDGAVGSASSSLGQAGWSSIGKDGISDRILGRNGDNIWVEYMPNEDNLSVKQLTQGVYRGKVTNPARGNKVISHTLTASKPTTDFAA